MPIIEWNVKFLVGIQEIDQHHKHLVDLLNETYDAFRNGVDIQQSAVDELVHLSSDHFASEERLMTQASYPQLAEHKQEHELFALRVSEFQKNYREHEHVSVEILWFLCNWVTHHILETDAKFGEFLDIQSIRDKVKRKFN